jgi:hypothetical protein
MDNRLGALTAAIEAAIDDYDFGSVTRISLDEMLATPKVISVLHRHLGSGEHMFPTCGRTGTELTSGREWKADIGLVAGKNTQRQFQTFALGAPSQSPIVRPDAYRH